MTQKDKIDRVYYGMYGTNGGDGLINKTNKIADWIDSFDEKHAVKCFYLLDRRKSWSKGKKIMALLGILFGSPAFILGNIEIIRIITGGHF
jgi:hypothetical protein